MNRQLNSAAIVRILDALNIRRQAALLSLPYTTHLAPPKSPPTSPEASSSSSSSSSPPSSSQLQWEERLPLPKFSRQYTRQMTAPLSAERECNELLEFAIAEAIQLQPSAKATGNTGASSSSSSSSSLALAVAADDGGTGGGGGTTKAPPAAPRPAEEIGSALEGRRLQGLSLDGLRFTASFNRSDLSHCSLARCYAAYSTFNLSRMTQCDLTGAQFHSCTFLGADAAGVRACNARFSHCQFRQCDLTGWDVRGATFFRCSFALSDLSRWGYDAQTTVIEPVEWSRCRRLGWHADRAGTAVRECRVVWRGMEQALSLPPAEVEKEDRGHSQVQSPWYGGGQGIASNNSSDSSSNQRKGGGGHRGGGGNRRRER